MDGIAYLHTIPHGGFNNKTFFDTKRQRYYFPRNGGRTSTIRVESYQISSYFLLIWACLISNLTST